MTQSSLWSSRVWQIICNDDDYDGDTCLYTPSVLILILIRCHLITISILTMSNAVVFAFLTLLLVPHDFQTSD